MLSVISLIAPVFGLIGLGFLAARLRWLDPSATRALSEFGYRVAVPALLFRVMSSTSMPQVSPLRLLGAYFAAITTIWVLATLATLVLLRRPAADAPAIAMGSCFGNGVMLGIPLILGALGNDAATPIALLVTVETAYLWILATLHMEIAGRGLGSISFAAIGGILRDVARNPIVGSVALGVAWAASGLTIPAIPDKLLALLAQSAIPIALFALGMSLSAYSIKGEIATMTLICALKLAFYPALALTFALWVFELPLLWASALFLFTSMPVGANAFVFAALYDRAVGSVSAAIAVSTVIAVISVTIVLAILRAGWLGGSP
jgi:malonate transporter and related proteins